MAPEDRFIHYDGTSSSQQPRKSKEKWDIQRPYIDELCRANPNITNKDIATKLGEERGFLIGPNSVSRRRNEWLKLAAVGGSAVAQREEGGKASMATEVSASQGSLASSASSTNGPSKATDKVIQDEASELDDREPPQNQDLRESFECEHTKLDVSGYIEDAVKRAYANAGLIITIFEGEMYPNGYSRSVSYIEMLRTSLRRFFSPTTGNVCESIGQLPEHQLQINEALCKLIIHACSVKNLATDFRSFYLPERSEHFPISSWQTFLRECIKETEKLVLEMIGRAKVRTYEISSRNEQVKLAIRTLWTPLRHLYLHKQVEDEDFICADYKQDEHLKKFDLVGPRDFEHVVGAQSVSSVTILEDSRAVYRSLSPCRVAPKTKTDDKHTSDTRARTTSITSSLVMSDQPYSQDDASLRLESNQEGILLKIKSLIPYTEKGTSLVSMEETVQPKPDLDTITQMSEQPYLQQTLKQESIDTTTSSFLFDTTFSISEEPADVEMSTDTQDLVRTDMHDDRDRTTEEEQDTYGIARELFVSTRIEAQGTKPNSGNHAYHQNTPISAPQGGYAPQVIPSGRQSTLAVALQPYSDGSSTTYKSTASFSSSLRRFKESGRSGYTPFTQTMNITVSSFSSMSISSRGR